MSKIIFLTKGKVAIVDDEDYEWLNQWKWHYGGRGYAVRTINHSKKLYMHKVILNVSEGMEVDHKNMNKLDNRRRNLRSCTVSQNQLNRGLMKTNTSGYKGVYWNKEVLKWVAYIRIEKKNRYIGSFLDIQEAVKAWNQKAKEVHGEYVRLNQI